MELPEGWEVRGRHWNTKSRACASTNTGSGLTLASCDLDSDLHIEGLKALARNVVVCSTRAGSFGGTVTKLVRCDAGSTDQSVRSSLVEDRRRLPRGPATIDRAGPRRLYLAGNLLRTVPFRWRPVCTLDASGRNASAELQNHFAAGRQRRKFVDGYRRRTRTLEWWTPGQLPGR